MPIQVSNIFHGAIPAPSTEIAETILETSGLKLERIVSKASSTPAGEWYDQENDEWVVVLSGSARIRFEKPDAEAVLLRGDCLTIPAHRRHRVEWTDPNETTVWLALHYRA